MRQRYADRPGGYTRVLRVEPKKEDQAPSAILEFVDGPHDMRFTLTARTLAYRMKNNLRMNDITQLNIKKVTRYRADGEEQLKDLVEKFRKMGNATYVPPAKKRVYPDPMDVEAMRRVKRLEKHEKEKPWW
jgi:large subunit ribosomal protein L17